MFWVQIQNQLIRNYNKKKVRDLIISREKKIYVKNLNFCAFFFILNNMFISIAAINCNRLEIANEYVFPAEKPSSESLRVISYNIRGESVLDCAHDNSWDVRKYKIQKLMYNYQPDIIGLQEVSSKYVSDLLVLFPEYTCITFDTSKEDKDVGLLIRTSRFIIEDRQYFWLSDNPWKQEIPLQPSWGARKPRIVVYATLFDRLTCKKCVIFCTHFDSTGIEVRVKSAQVLMQQQKKIASCLPVIIAGDFNLMMNPLKTDLIKKAEEAYMLLANTEELYDIRDFTGSHHFGPDGSWIGWPYDKYATPLGCIAERLDHIFVRHCQVLQEGVLNLKVTHDCATFISPSHDDYDQILYPSDHLPIITDIIIQ